MQTNFVVQTLIERLNLEVEIKIIRTKGDKDRNIQLSYTDEPGVFTRAIEKELQKGNIDVAVHSLKDLPLQQPCDLIVAAFPTRADPGETLAIFPNVLDLDEDNIPIRKSAIVGTGSPRRAAQISGLRNDLTIKPIRGNITTRIEKIRDHEYDAVIFAVAGLDRLNLFPDDLVFHSLDIKHFPPAPGQGALAVEMRKDDPDIQNVRKILNDPLTETCVTAERKLLELFGGGCSLPLGALVQKIDDQFECTGFISINNKPRWAKITCKDVYKGIEQLWEKLNNV